MHTICDEVDTPGTLRWSNPAGQGELPHGNCGASVVYSQPPNHKTRSGRIERIDRLAWGGAMFLPDHAYRADRAVVDL